MTTGANKPRCVIIGAAPGPWGAELIRPDDFVAVCDGGLEYALANGLRYRLLVGDFDSYRGEVPEGPSNPAALCGTSTCAVPGGGSSAAPELVRLPCEKDDTDIGFAVRILLRRGFREFLLLGAAGGRFDHTLGNLSVGAAIAARGGCGIICGERPGEFCFVFRHGRLWLEPAPGAFVSLFPWGSRRAVVSNTGFKYPLTHGVVDAHNTLGVSNEFLPGVDTASITAERGTVVAVAEYGGDNNALPLAADHVPARFEALA